MSVPVIAVLDYGMGNLFSVEKACFHAGLKPVISSSKNEIMRADGMIVPGVGAFGDAMKALSNKGLVNGIIDFIKSGKPLMGICLGLQILFSESQEFGLHKGLGMLPGKVIKFNSGQDKDRRFKVPQVGWNQINVVDSFNSAWEDSELAGIPNGEFMYFVHSFYAIPDSSEIVLSRSTYEGVEYCSAVKKDNIFACQFHPEKSAHAGLTVYNNFRKIIEKNA